MKDKMPSEAKCFLCSPDSSLVYSVGNSCFAMLGLGPIVEGFSLIATKEHIPSMMDLSADNVGELCELTSNVRERLSAAYGEVVMTEHGRVAPCLLNRKQSEGHCFHAHRLVFPWTGDLTSFLSRYGLELHEYRDFIECHQEFEWEAEYLYYERQDGTCIIAAAPPRLARQFFRLRIAEAIGQPELADWMEYPRLDVIEAAGRRLGMDIG